MYSPTISKKLNEYLLIKTIIIPIIFEDHQSTLMIFRKENHYYICIIDSGRNLIYHDEEKTTKNKKPYKILCYDNINSIINIINLINFMKILNIDDKRINIDCENRKYKYINNIIKILKLEEIISIEEEIISIDEEPKHRFKIIFNKSSFEIIYHIFDSNRNNSMTSEIEDKIYNVVNLSNPIANPILKNIYNELIFHTYTNQKNIFISPQKSGSCSWFSIYWAICLYYVIKQEKDYDNYINKVLTKCINIAKEIFTIDNLKKESFNSSKSHIILMNNLRSKLYNMNMLEDNKYVINIINQNIVYNDNNLITNTSNFYTNNKYLEEELEKYNNATNTPSEMFDMILSGRNDIFLILYRKIYIIEQNDQNKKIYRLEKNLINRNTFFFEICKFINKYKSNLENLFKNSTTDSPNLLFIVNNIITLFTWINASLKMEEILNKIKT